MESGKAGEPSARIAFNVLHKVKRSRRQRRPDGQAWEGGTAAPPGLRRRPIQGPVLFAALCFTRFAYKYLFILHVLYYQGITEALIV